MSNLSIFFLVLAFPVVIYLVSRMVSAGYFRSRLSYDNLRSKNKQDLTNDEKDEVKNDG